MIVFPSNLFLGIHLIHRHERRGFLRRRSFGDDGSLSRGWLDVKVITDQESSLGIVTVTASQTVNVCNEMASGKLNNTVGRMKKNWILGDYDDR